MWNLLLSIFNINPTLHRQPDWIVGVFFLLLILIAVTITFHKKKVFLVIQSVFSQRHFSLLNREGKVFNEHFYILPLSVIILSFSLFCYTLFDYFLPDYHFPFSTFSLFLMSMVFIMADYALHRLFFRLFCYFFDYQNDFYYFNLYHFSFLLINSLLLFPTLLCYYYIPLKIILPIYIFVLFILYLFAHFRIFTSKITEVNLFYFFIYFCTFEILPYLIVLKWVKVLI